MTTDTGQARGAATPISLKMGDDMRQWLKEQARINHRSFSGEVLHRLEQSRAQQLSKGTQA